MNTIKLLRLIGQIRKELPSNVHEYNSQTGGWKVYWNFCGFVSNDYFDLYFKETISGRISIEVAATTEDPVFWVELIKIIEPNAKVENSNE